MFVLCSFVSCSLFGVCRLSFVACCLKCVVCCGLFDCCGDVLVYCVLCVVCHSSFVLLRLFVCGLLSGVRFAVDRCSLFVVRCLLLVVVRRLL